MIGELSAKYESNGDPGAVSSGDGDAGGVSYGAYQLSSTAGSAHSFVAWLKQHGHAAGNILSSYLPGSREFSAAWIYCAEHIADFGEIQHEYIKHAYYDVAVEALAGAGYNVENHHEVMQQVIWSRAVQYGSYITEMFETAALALNYPTLSDVDAPQFDAAMIEAIYWDVCRTPEWTNGSPALREGLYTRYESECAEALAMLLGGNNNENA